MHTHTQWRAQCKNSAQLLKQQVSADTANQDSHTEHVQQLEKTTTQALADAAKLLGLMEAVGQRSTDSGGRGTPNYSSGIRHVKQMVEEIEKHRTRVGKLAEAQKLQTEQFKQLHSCEKDAQEVHLHVIISLLTSTRLHFTTLQMFDTRIIPRHTYYPVCVIKCWI